MKFKLTLFAIIITCSVIIFCPQSPAQNTNLKSDFPDSVLNSSDYIKMKTGSILFGKLKSADKGRLIFDIKDLGDEEILFEEISILIARSVNFEIDLADKKRIVSRIDAGKSLGYIMGYAGSDTLNINMNDVIKITRLDETFADRLDGFINGGYSYTSSSAINRFTLSNLASYQTKDVLFFQSFDAVYTTSDGDGIERIDARMGTLWEFTNNWLALETFLYQKILSLGLSDRIGATTAGGRRIINNRNFELNLLTGLAFSKEYSTNGYVSGIQTDIPGILDINIGIPNPDLTFYGTAIYYRSLTIPDRNRVDLQMNFNYEFIHDFTTGFEITYSFDNKPLDTDEVESDFNASFTLGYKF